LVNLGQYLSSLNMNTPKNHGQQMDSPDPFAPVYPLTEAGPVLPDTDQDAPAATPEEEEGKRIDEHEMDTYPGTSEEDEPQIPSPDQAAGR
jgi:hypothetical protein